MWYDNNSFHDFVASQTQCVPHTPRLSLSSQTLGDQFVPIWSGQSSDSPVNGDITSDISIKERTISVNHGIEHVAISTIVADNNEGGVNQTMPSQGKSIEEQIPQTPQRKIAKFKLTKPKMLKTRSKEIELMKKDLVLIRKEAKKGHLSKSFNIDWLFDNSKIFD